MKKTYGIVLSLVAVVLLINPVISRPVTAQKTYDLKYQIPVGTKFIMKTSGTTTIETDQMGTIVTTDLSGTSEDIFTVLEASPDKGLTIEYEFGERTQDMESTMGSDTTDFSELIGKKVKFLLSLKGEVDGYEGFDVLPNITTSTQETLDEATYKLGAKTLFFALSDKPVKIGDTWTDEETEDVPVQGSTMALEVKSTYKVLEEVQKDGMNCLKIEYEVVTKASGEFEQQGTPLSLERETISNGTLYFAYEKGIFIASESESKGEGIITVESMGIEIPQTIVSKGTVTVEFVK